MIEIAHINGPYSIREQQYMRDGKFSELAILLEKRRKLAIRRGLFISDLSQLIGQRELQWHFHAWVAGEDDVSHLVLYFDATKRKYYARRGKRRPLLPRIKPDPQDQTPVDRLMFMPDRTNRRYAQGRTLTEALKSQLNEAELALAARAALEWKS